MPDHIKRAAREMNRKAFQDKLKEIGMSGYDASLYEEYSNSVSNQVLSLRGVLSNLQAKNKERHWSRHQTSGELDDVKLIDGILIRFFLRLFRLFLFLFVKGLLGDKTIFRRRTEQQPEIGVPQVKPKIFRVVVDVSGSMYRLSSISLICSIIF